MLGNIPPGATEAALTPEQNAQWEQFLLSWADQIDHGIAQMESWHATLAGVFAALNSPFIQAPAMIAGVPVAWTQAFEDSYQELLVMGHACTRWLREAASGARATFVDGKDWSIEGFPTDTFHIGTTDKGIPIRVASDQPRSMVGVHPYLIAAGAVGAFAIQAFTLYVVYRAITGTISIIEGIVQTWNARTWSQCIQNAKDPKDCLAAQRTQAQVITQLKKTETPNIADQVDRITSSLLWFALGASGLYLGMKVIPPALAAWDKRNVVQAA